MLPQTLIFCTLHFFWACVYRPWDPPQLLQLCTCTAVLRWRGLSSSATKTFSFSAFKLFPWTDSPISLIPHLPPWLNLAEEWLQKKWQKPWSQWLLAFYFHLMTNKNYYDVPISKGLAYLYSQLWMSWVGLISCSVTSFQNLIMLNIKSRL